MRELALMSRDKKPKSKSGAGGKRFPSREKIKYAGIPTAYWEAIEQMVESGPDTDPKFDGRSVAYMVTLAVKLFLQQNGRLPPTK